MKIKDMFKQALINEWKESWIIIIPTILVLIWVFIAEFIIKG